MKDKVTLTLDREIVKAIDQLSIDVARSRSDTLNLFLKQTMANADLVQNFKASGGTAVTIKEGG